MAEFTARATLVVVFAMVAMGSRSSASDDVIRNDSLSLCLSLSLASESRPVHATMLKTEEHSIVSWLTKEVLNSVVTVLRALQLQTGLKSEGRGKTILYFWLQKRQGPWHIPVSSRQIELQLQQLRHASDRITKTQSMSRSPLHELALTSSQSEPHNVLVDVP